MTLHKARIRTRYSAIHLKPAVIVFSVIATLASTACTMDETQQRVGSGAAIGALAGGLLGGNNKSAVIGAAVGAGGGYLVDQRAKREDAEAEAARLRRENEMLRQQQY